MKNNNTILIVLGLLAVVLLFGANLGLFAVLPLNAIVPTDDVETNSKQDTDFLGFEDDIKIGWDARTTADYEYIGYMKFEVPQAMADLVKGGVNLSKVELYVYLENTIGSTDIGIYEVGDSWNEGNVNWGNKPRIGPLITARRVSSSDEDDYIKFSPLIDYFERELREGDNKVSFAFQQTVVDLDDYIFISTKEKYPLSNLDSPYIIIELVEEIVCTENEIKQFGEDYYICRNTEWIKILDILALSDAEQTALMETINQLGLTVEEKQAIIQNLTTTLEGQLIMIKQLEATTAEKAQIISQLELTLEEQALIITEMELNVVQQALIIDELNLSIQEQAQLIQQMQTNLAAKAALIQQLEVENQAQAALIAEMGLSFQDQAEIIMALENLIGDDAEIILSLYATVEDQAALISELELTKNELADLITAMDLTITENAELINKLKLTTEEQLEIIANLELSLEQERELISKLRLTIEEQDKLIEDLEAKPTIPEFDLKSIWEDYKLLILIIGGLLLLLLLGGKRK
ncbi:hypothetical protein LCGC14_1055490 [marine sediment metagenome]|uniref:Carbohydrate-binding module family 96 domain-containing protein n=1 Tax=marine sediment metagenome TaxID=412755 RepID=A0A0F9MS38_9ZZZZ